MLKEIGSIPVVGWAMVLSIKYIKIVRVISVLMDVDMFIKDVEGFLKDNKGHEEEMIKKTAPNEEVEKIMTTILNIMNIKERIMGD